jgi:hypothetical protein
MTFNVTMFKHASAAGLTCHMQRNAFIASVKSAKISEDDPHRTWRHRLARND